VNPNGKEVPLDHIPPVFGKTSVMYRQKRFTGEVYAIYNGWKRLQDYSPSGEDNLVYATAQGMPAWMTLNVRTGYKFTPNLGIQVAVENLLDQNYRVFASGISAPGRNLVITLRGNL
jgi:hemoglobin/transferrin/lactoferrin receptor protein